MAAPPDQRLRLETAHRNELRLLKLVSGLLDFSRIEAGRVEAFYEPTDLAALTTDEVLTKPVAPVQLVQALQHCHSSSIHAAE
jgi:signal transduction histidine kinase